jgi:hypothetical protein
MFRRKYNVSLLTSKWDVIKRNVKMEIIPNKSDFIWIDDIYYRVEEIVHSISNKHEVFLIVSKENEKYLKKNLQD